MFFDDIQAVDYCAFELDAFRGDGFRFEEPETQDAEAGCAGYGTELDTEASVNVALPSEEGKC